MGVFERFLGFGSLEWPKVLLVWWHMVLPISSGGVSLISMEIIVLVAHLRNQALVAVAIVSKFLLEVIGSLGPFLF